MPQSLEAVQAAALELSDEDRAQLGERAGRRHVSPVLIAQVLVGLGKHTEAIEKLSEAVAAKSTDLIWLAVRPHFDPLREIDAFMELLERVNLGGTEAT